MRRLFVDGFRNLSAGLRLVVFRRPNPAQVAIHADQIPFLLLISALVDVLLGFIAAGEGAIFSSYGLLAESFFICGLLLVTYAVCRLVGDTTGFIRFAILLLATSPWLGIATEVLLALVRSIDDSNTAYTFAFWGVVVWFIAVWAYVAKVSFPQGRNPARWTVLLTSLLVVVPAFSIPMPDYWYAATRETEESAGVRLNVEDTYYRQPILLTDALEAMPAERRGQADVYFVGFGSYAAQSVFRDEVRHVRRHVGELFDATDRSVSLINHRDTVLDTPLASRSNLKYVLEAIGSRMDPEDDMLVLYLTSHGSSGGELSVRFWPLQLNGLSARDLRGLLDGSGIRWRVLIVSACYSGSFIEALKGDDTLIITSSASDRQSFGCSNENEYTYFGRAYFKEALPQTRSFIDAFELAEVAVAERERTEELEPSNPQMVVGSAIGKRLRMLESR